MEHTTAVDLDLRVYEYPIHRVSILKGSAADFAHPNPAGLSGTTAVAYYHARTISFFF